MTEKARIMWFLIFFAVGLAIGLFFGFIICAGRC